MKSRLSASRRAKAVSSKADSLRSGFKPLRGGSRFLKGTVELEASLPTYPPSLAHWESPAELLESGSETPES